MTIKRFFFSLIVGFMLVPAVWAQTTNYDEALVPQYDLPDVLMNSDGTCVKTARQWEKVRRKEILNLLSKEEYGFTPTGKIKTSYKLLRENKASLGGLATSQQVLVTFSGEGKEMKALLLAYIPNQRKGKVPVFVSYNYKGNHSICNDEEILYSPYFERIADPSSSELQRNTQPSRWPLRMIIERGYAVVTMCYQDIFPDNADGGEKSVTTLFPQSADPTTEWQALGAWAWGNSRMADWVVKQPWANKHQLIVMGHSRQGKAALWAGAQDQRFQVVISNDSGCGGAALSRREFGERIADITSVFPHWFCRNLLKYTGNEQALPFDQHALLALIAPRYLYVASAEDDQWADPYGEYLSAYQASEVFALYGLKGITSPLKPKLHQPIMNHVGYHIRAGIHDVTDYDWSSFMDFCDKAFKRK